MTSHLWWRIRISSHTATTNRFLVFDKLERRCLWLPALKFRHLRKSSEIKYFFQTFNYFLNKLIILVNSSIKQMWKENRKLFLKIGKSVFNLGKCFWSPWTNFKRKIYHKYLKINLLIATANIWPSFFWQWLPEIVFRLSCKSFYISTRWKIYGHFLDVYIEKPWIWPQ